MMSRALRTLGLLLLMSGAAAAQEQGRPAERAPAEQSSVLPSRAASGWGALLAGRRGGPPVASTRKLGLAPRRDSSGRVWSSVDLELARGARPAQGWTTQRFGRWSYSYSSDGTSCISQRTAQLVRISCQ